MEVWQTTNLDEAVAEEFFGWKWMAYRGIPVRGTPGYPQECIVRQFLSVDAVKNPRWQEFLKENDGRETTGDEPLAYCYCSSQGPAIVPHFSGHHRDIATLEKELRRRKLWSQYRQHLWAQIGGDGEIEEDRLADADCESRCIAALAVVGSKHVRPVPESAS